MGYRRTKEQTVPPPALHNRFVPLRLGLLALPLFALIASSCVPASSSYTAVAPPPPPPPAAPIVNNPLAEKAHDETVVALASWYGPGFEGHRTATGERFSSSRMTAAGKGLPLGSRVVVTNLHNGRSATVRINDCGPMRAGRRIDLSKKAAREIGIIDHGTAKVEIKVIHKPTDAVTCKL